MMGMINVIQKKANVKKKKNWYAALVVIVFSSDQSYYFYNLLEQVLGNIFKDFWNSFLCSMYKGCQEAWIRYNLVQNWLNI